MKISKLSEYRNLFLFTQLGLSVVSPVLLCAGAGWLMDRYWNTPSWVMVVCILVGLASGMISAWKLLKKMLAFSEKDDPEDRL